MSIATVTDIAEKRQPANADTKEDGTRWYIHPITGERFLSVTTALKIIAKEALVFWAAKVVAEEAMESLPTLIKASRHRPCEETGERRCGRCRVCAVIDLRGRPTKVRDDAGDLGSRVHAAAEKYALTGELDNADEEIAPFLVQYLAWFAQFKPTYEASEMTVISRQYGYAGTLDGIIRLGWCPPKHVDLVGKQMVMDIKSGKGVYDEFQLQLAAYKHADAVMLPDGTELPMPETDDVALVLHLRPDMYQVHPINIPPTVHGAFLSALALYRWQIEEGKDAIGRAMYKPPATPRAITPKPAKTAAPKKTATPTARKTAAAGQPRRTAAQSLGLVTFPSTKRSSGNTLTDDSIPF